MRTLNELLAADSDAWRDVARQASEAGAEVAAPTSGDGEATLLAAQITTRSPMGAIAFHSGGFLVDHGWLRVLGASSRRIGGGLVAWNESLGGAPLDPSFRDALIVAYDALGGFFAVNGGRWDAAPGATHYLPPDTWAWENLELSYSAWLSWTLSDALRLFYEGMRWPGWEAEVEALGPDEAMAVYPFIGFETTPIADRQRRPVPARELWTLTHRLAREAGELPPGGKVDIKFHE